MRFLATFALALWLPFAAVAQDDDRGRLTRWLEDSLSGAGREVRVEGFRGALSSRAEIDRLTIADAEGVWITVSGVVLDWNRLEVLRGNIQINELSAQEIVLVRPPQGDTTPSPEAAPFALPDLPVAVNIGRLAATRIVLGDAVVGQRVEGSLEASMTLDDGEGRTTIQILRLDDGPEGRIDLQASYSNASNVLVLSLDAVEGPGGIAATMLDLPGGPAASLTLRGSGPLTGFAAEVTLATDEVPRLAGRFTLSGTADGGRSFAADFSGDLAPLFLPEQAAFFGPEVGLSVAGVRDANGRLDLQRLSLSAQALTLEGAAVVAGDGTPQRLALTGRLGLASGQPVALPFAADVNMRVEAAAIDVSYDAAAGDTWTARFDVTGVTRDDLALDRLRLTGSGRMGARAGQGLPGVFGGTFRFAAEGLAPTDPDLAAALGPEVQGRLTLSKQSGDDALRIGELALDGQGYGLTARGLVQGLNSGFTLSGNMQGGFDDISRLSGLAGRPLSGAARLTAQGTGSPLTGAFDVTAQVSGQDLTVDIAELDGLLRGRSQIDLSARRDETGTLLRDLVLVAGPARLAVQGRIATAGSDLTAEIDFPDLTVLGGSYAGGISGQATLTGTPESLRATLRGTGRSLRLGQAELDALLAGDTALDLAAARTGERITIERAEVLNPQAQARVTGFYDPAGSDLTAALRLSDLSRLGPDYAGELIADATFTGTPEDGSLTLTGTGRELRTGRAELDALLAGDTALDLALTRQGERIAIERAEVLNPAAEARVAGVYDPAGSDLTATVRISDLARLGRGYGGAVSADAAFTGTPQDGRLTLDGTARDLRLGQTQADRLLAGDSTLRLALGLRDGVVQVDEAELRNPQVTLDATGRIEDDIRRVALTGRLANLALLVPEFPGPLTLTGDLVQDGAGYQVDVQMQGPGQIDATARGRVAANFGSADLRLAGSAQAGLANAFLGSRAVQGGLSFDLGLNGPLALSSLSGPVRLSGGRLSDPALPFALEGVEATATLGGGSANVQATAGISSGGQVAVSGQVGLSAPFSSDLGVTLSGATLRDPTLFETTADASLRVSGPLTGGGRIAGRVDLRETELHVPNASLAGSGQIPDMRHVNEPAEVRATRRRAGLLGDGAGAGVGGSGALALDILISAPARVFLRGRGLDAELGGQVHLGGTTANVVPSGALELIRGRLDILGRRLVLTTARLDLQGDLIPVLDIAATNDSDGVLTTVRITGPATQPEVSFTSSPELPEEEVLARLLFGRGLDNISPLQAAQLASAVATLAGRGGEGIIGRLRKGFGLDDLDIVTDGQGGATLRAGKYISENVYTEVEVDQGGRSRINLNLDIRPGVTVKGHVGSEGEAGVGIFLQRDY